VVDLEVTAAGEILEAAVIVSLMALKLRMMQRPGFE